jgi:hypothetical protein
VDAAGFVGRIHVLRLMGGALWLAALVISGVTVESRIGRISERESH